MGWFLVLYALGIVYLSLYPFHFVPHGGYPLFSWVPLDARRQIFDFLINVLFYIPLGGALLALLGGSIRAWPAAVFCGTLLSLSIETIQFWDPGRFTTLNDLLANGFGTAVGASIAVVLCRPRIAAHIERVLRTERWLLSPVQGLFLIQWILWQGFPFFPTLALLRIREAMQILGHPAWDLLTMAEAGIATAVLVLVLGSSWWIWLALAVLPLQALLLDRQFSPQLIVAALIGWLVGTKLRRFISPACLAMGLILWLIVEEFRPFHSGVTLQRFMWLPFQTVFSSNTTAFYVTIFRKLFLYTIVVWSIRRAGVSRAKKTVKSVSEAKVWTYAIAIPAVILSLGEWAQQYLEGRTPESTDLVLLFAGAAFLLGAVRRSSAQNKSNSTPDAE